jgi:hypothetical protein
MNRSSKILMASLWLVACSENASSPSPSEPDAQESKPSDTPATAGYKTSTRNVLQWKRAAVIENDLSRALELSTDELCKELSDKNCIRDVHLVPMGGNEPYTSGLMKPSTEPLATTPAVIDRVLLSACSTRATRDAEGSPKVFTQLSFDQPLPAADDAAVTATVSDLYKRLLAREPSAEELSLVAALAEPDGDDALTAKDFATLACFSIGSSTEFLFF